MTNQEQRIIFSDNLKRHLQRAEKTQKEVADAIGVSAQTFNTWIKGIAIPRMGKIQALADYFRINKSDLIDEPSTDSDPDTPMSGPAEDRLISIYRDLNDEGQEKLLDYAEDLSGMNKYKKCNSLEMVEEEA